MYFELRPNNRVYVYLDRDLARQAGINPRDKVAFYRGAGALDQFVLTKHNRGWQIRELSIGSGLLATRVRITPRASGLFLSFVFDARGGATPTEVKLVEEHGKTCIHFTLPDILPPAELQGHPLVLTRGYQGTILALGQSLAAEAGFRPGHSPWFGYQPSHYPEKLLIFRPSDAR